MKTLTFGPITVCIAEIPDESQSGRRRDVERAVVADIVSRHLGPGYTVAHRPDGAPYLIAKEGRLPACELNEADFSLLQAGSLPTLPHISITHSRRIAAVAFSADSPVGIDAEEWRDALLRVRTRFLSPSEMELFTTTDQILAAWTIKEAVYKLAGIPALDFAASISISPDMTLAHVGDNTYRLTTFTDGPTTITLAQHKNFI